jgi:hypothetical protein
MVPPFHVEGIVSKGFLTYNGSMDDETPGVNPNLSGLQFGMPTREAWSPTPFARQAQQDQRMQRLQRSAADARAGRQEFSDQWAEAQENLQRRMGGPGVPNMLGGGTIQTARTLFGRTPAAEGGAASGTGRKIDLTPPRVSYDHAATAQGIFGVVHRGI